MRSRVTHRELIQWDEWFVMKAEAAERANDMAEKQAAQRDRQRQQRPLR